MPIAPTLVYAGTLPPQRGWSAALHTHAGHWELLTLNAGQLIVHGPAGQLRLDRGQAVLYPPQVPHRETSAGPGAVEIVYVGLAGELPLEPQITRLADTAGRLRMLSQWLVESTPQERSGRPQFLLLELLVHELTQSSGRTSAWLDPVVRHIRQNLASDLSVAVLAQVAGMSPFHFTRRFRQTLGTTPGAYVRRARVTAARDLLAAYSLPARAVAPMVGLRDAAELSRVLYREAHLRIRDLRR